MGRIVRGARVRAERYTLAVPEIAPVAPEPIVADAVVPSDEFGFGGEDAALFADAPFAPPTPAVDLDAVRAEAQALLDDAGRNAEALLTEAHDRARELVEEASTRAAQIERDAQAAGHDTGFRAGREAADREMNEMLATMRGILEMAHVERHKLIESAEPELVRLALGIAERVLHQQVALDRGVVVEMAKNAITRLIERDTVTVRVNPADLERIREHREELVALGDIRTLRVIEDQRVDRGGVVVETEGGTIDARIGTQLEEARKVLHIEDELVVEPSSPAAHATHPSALRSLAS